MSFPGVGPRAGTWPWGSRALQSALPPGPGGAAVGMGLWLRQVWVGFLKEGRRPAGQGPLTVGQAGDPAAPGQGASCSVGPWVHIARRACGPRGLALGRKAALCREETESWRPAGRRRRPGLVPCPPAQVLPGCLPAAQVQERSWRAAGPLRVGRRAGGRTSPQGQVTGAPGAGKGGGNPTWVAGVGFPGSREQLPASRSTGAGRWALTPCGLGTLGPGRSSACLAGAPALGPAPPSHALPHGPCSQDAL